MDGCVITSQEGHHLCTCQRTMGVLGGCSVSGELLGTVCQPQHTGCAINQHLRPALRRTSASSASRTPVALVCCAIASCSATRSGATRASLICCTAFWVGCGACMQHKEAWQHGVWQLRVEAVRATLLAWRQVVPTPRLSARRRSPEPLQLQL